ncbi:RDD family protein [Flammeovirga aprica]|uniref:RDD family protein n=1 Tax=Flammeovirga aprica JL-4 TaxID=694437 RepID=A0A7X9XC37_9BACT|nr:RDD family protein [Flammeovirga aprica]NME71397.1 RDD family protein [Flammeovirga aprica JL-4]
MEANNCPRCKTTYTYGSKFCYSCGCSLEHEKAENQNNDIYLADSITEESYSIDTLSPSKAKVTEKNYQVVDWEGLKAPLKDRFFASLIDGLITLAFLSLSFLFFKLLMNELMSEMTYDRMTASFTFTSSIFFVIAALFLLVAMSYTVIKDGIPKGQSIGKNVFGLMVIDTSTHMPCTKSQSFVRNIILSVLSLLPGVGTLVELLFVIMTKSGQRLGDYGANTQVIESRCFDFDKQKLDFSKVRLKTIRCVTQQTDYYSNDKEESTSWSDIMLTAYVSIMFIYASTSMLIRTFDLDIENLKGIAKQLCVTLDWTSIIAFMLISFSLKKGRLKYLSIVISIIITIYNIYSSIKADELYDQMMKELLPS